MIYLFNYFRNCAPYSKYLIKLLMTYDMLLKLPYRCADIKGTHKIRLTVISAYRKKATTVHWRVIATVILCRDKHIDLWVEFYTCGNLFCLH